LQSGLIDTAGTTTINAGGKLTGNGTVGALAVSGTFAPGVAGPSGSGGVVTVDAASSFATGAAFNLQISGTGAGQYGQLAAGGQTVTLSGSTQLTLTLGSGYTPNGGDIITLISNPSNAVAQNFYSGSTLLTDGTQFFAAGYEWQINYEGAPGADGGNINDVYLTSAIPEPGTWATLASGLGMLLLLQRNRRRKG
jgi:hypothetical protein